MLTDYCIDPLLESWLKSLPTVALTESQFDSLSDYSISIPTGVTIGKQWKAGFPYRDPQLYWVLREYVADPDRTKSALITNKRILVEGSSDPALWPRESRELPVELL